jgi:hypothetical protein
MNVFQDPFYEGEEIVLGGIGLALYGYGVLSGKGAKKVSCSPGIDAG